MRSLFDDISVGYLQEGIQHLRDKADFETRIGKYGKREDYYYGGRRPLSDDYLIRHEDEDAADWAERMKRAAHWGYTGRVGHAFVSGIGGAEITRELSDASEQQNDWFTKIYERARFSSYQRQVYQGQVVIGDAFAVPGYSGDLGRIRILTPHAEKINVEKHPDDPLVEISVTEERINPNDAEKPWYWIWTAERFVLIDSDSKPVRWQDYAGNSHEGWEDNPYKVIPYAHVRGKTMLNEYWGCSLLDDVIEMNQLINNGASNLDRLVLKQAFSQPVIKGELLPIKVKSGPTHTINLDPEGGEFYYATPNADIAGSLSWLQLTVNSLFEIGGVPVSIVRGGSASSGYQLEVEYRTMREIIDDAIVEATMFERELAKLVCIVNNVHRGEMKGAMELPADPDVSIVFDSQLIPPDIGRDRERDQAEVSKGFLLQEDYVQKWIDGIETNEDAREYVAQLNQSSERQREADLALYRDGLLTVEMMVRRWVFHDPNAPDAEVEKYVKALAEDAKNRPKPEGETGALNLGGTIL